jgi:acyl dehydratase
VAEFDPSSFILAEKGHKYEDFFVGQTFDHHWGRTLSSGDNDLFSTAMCWWTPMYLNAEFARSHGHPNVVINPMLVMCTVVGLSVEDLSEAGGPFLGVESCRFHAPVYPGDTLTARSTVLDQRLSNSRPDFGIVKWKTEGEKQDGKMVIELVRVNLVAKRQPL